MKDEYDFSKAKRGAPASEPVIKIGDRVKHIVGTPYDVDYITEGDAGTLAEVDADDGARVIWDNPLKKRTHDMYEKGWWIDLTSLMPENT
jgi:hypothetical protein